jgi:DNA polymerase-3 subunit epsilon
MVKFAVLDTETTGFSFSTHDRIVEIAVVLLDEDLNIEGSRTWLINPHRDLGPTHIHGIKASWVRDAPEFREVANSLATLLDGRVVVGHNVSFDRQFLFAEFARFSARQEHEEGGWLCTKALAKWAFPGFSKYSLEALCAHFGIENENAHSALSDTLATAKLFKTLSESGTGIRDVVHSESFDLQPWEYEPVSEILADYPRPDTSGERNPGLIQRLVAELPAHGFSQQGGEYVVLLGRALSDGVLTEAEVLSLVGVAKDLGLGADEVERLHDRYFQDLASQAWADGLLTYDEKTVLTNAAAVLGISGFSLEKAFSPANAGEVKLPFREGDSVCLTGTMVPDKNETGKLLQDFGIIVSESVTKSTTGVVAADADSMSGKAVKARRYGIPVLSCEVIWQLYKA